MFFDVYDCLQDLLFSEMLRETAMMYKMRELPSNHRVKHRDAERKRMIENLMLLKERMESLFAHKDDDIREELDSLDEQWDKMGIFCENT